ncbi:MAG: molybdenum cofactor biosynthesis protein MoaD [Bacteroidetes bacterium]|nr:molybdenum cofactor biosynthesis protein MoaD [Bacteroidota bacterium]
MPTIRFTSALSRFFPDLGQTALPGSTVAELLQGAETQFPGLRRYLLDDQGALRQHVNIFVNGERIQDRDRLSDALAERDEVFILQALSGG